MMNAVDYEEKLTYTLCNAGQKRVMWLVTEDGLYEILMQSRKPIAKAFKKEFKKVLKSLRKNGGYINNQENLNDEEILANAMLVANNVITNQKSKIEQLQKKVETDKNKVAFAEALATSEDTILIRELAKLITQNGYTIGQNRLFDWLRDNNYLMKNKHNSPYQIYVEQGLFAIQESLRASKDGSIIILTTRVTVKGQIYFLKKFEKLAKIEQIDKVLANMELSLDFA